MSLLSPEGTDTTRYVLPLDESENMFRAGDSATVLQTPMPSNSRKSNEPAAEAADVADGREPAEDDELVGQVRSGQG